MSATVFDFNHSDLSKNIALSPFGYWPKTKWQRFIKSIPYRLRLR